MVLQKEELEQKHLHLVQIVESEKTAKWQYTQQCEELTVEIKKLRAEVRHSKSFTLLHSRGSLIICNHPLSGSSLSNTIQRNLSTCRDSDSASLNSEQRSYTGLCRMEVDEREMSKCFRKFRH